ncbi:MAG: hypothetical protein ABJA79_05035 [Parafilimonas sp.]
MKTSFLLAATITLINYSYSQSLLKQVINAGMPPRVHAQLAESC